MSDIPDNSWAAVGHPESGAPTDLQPDTFVDPWAAMSTNSDSGNADWLNTAPDLSASNTGIDWLNPFEHKILPLDSWVNDGLTWVIGNFRETFQHVRVPIEGTLTLVENALQTTPALLTIALFGLLAWQFSSRRLAIGAVLSLLLIGFLGVWSEAMTTLSLVLTSVGFCIVIGLPLGILAARSNLVEKIVRPLLDAMQTTPAFVYLVPVVMLFGIGNVAGVLVTIIFAMAPLVRLTNLGIRQVRPDLVEASRSFGASSWQLLTKVQLPLALPTIMAGVNQTLMLALSMVVIASMIAVGGLGQMVLRGIGRLDMGLATIGGLGIVILAILLDRLTQALTKQQRNQRWYQQGPVGFVWRLMQRFVVKNPVRSNKKLTSLQGN
ncbi:glycine betaine/L-proline ABC transporter permease ProW [Solimicrobium silvestre]|uniref:ABC-type proline/glycine betaine transport system permease component n=1 Tax=Solimicrobium silvestre TaxID=2099400 RepID=A0A2S9GSM6_9BURK|nr:glycine betaine/L-proline ABC transporter permease ProW [Solimicrobium silvestre]PRC90705.1 ABC-type proline/glycine betaine transport system permease component [Solimicrobium silvestre]